MDNTLRPYFTPLYLAFLLQHLTSSVAGDYSYIPVENIFLNCGSSGKSTGIDGRTWIGDVNSTFFPLEQSKNRASITNSPVQESPSVGELPYATARFSLSPFTYVFPLTSGQKFIRLYFYPASYPNFNRSQALFSVKAGPFTLLHNFNASLTADFDLDPRGTISIEFCVNIGVGERLNITFTPSPSDSNSYAFINGIELLSMPTNLYYTRTRSYIPFIGRDYHVIDNKTALEMVHRINVGGSSINSPEDTGMFRSWSEDGKYIKDNGASVIPVNTSIHLSFTIIPEYTAPENVYQTARTMGINKTMNKSYNLTWEFPVDSQFIYLVRLHFCEFQSEVNEVGDRVFHIFIADLTAQEAADVISWSGGKRGVPVYRDYAVMMVGNEGEKKMNLSISLEANPYDWQTTYNDAILNGIEIFKLSDFNGNLAGTNPNRRPLIPLQSTKSNDNRTSIIAVVGGVVSSFIVLLILGLLIFRFRRAKRVKESGSSYGTKSTKTCRSTLSCRYFSLAEIKAATKNFDEVSIIGVGGFGDVYRGFIDGGATPVAIKRLKPGSQQGAHEFKTEIEILSQLRHHHLVSLIGFCNDDKEMILVYDYMACGTLCGHLYNTDKPPLPWMQRLQICLGAARGLNYLHIGAKHSIIHRDVKSTNILLDEKWTAKVSDFGLSKFGPTTSSKAHVSTAVKGSFGYLDPEYYRRQQLTEKSDVYSFGVVLCEVLCARPPIIHMVEQHEMSLAEWAPHCYRNGKLDQIVDPYLKGEITPECLKKFGEIAVNCLHDNGTQRPSMNDVVWGLELALQLQESAEKDVLQPQGEKSFDNKESDGLMSSMSEFSEIMNPQGR